MWTRWDGLFDMAGIQRQPSGSSVNIWCFIHVRLSHATRTRMPTKSSTSVSSSYVHQVLHQCFLVVSPPSPPPVFTRRMSTKSSTSVYSSYAHQVLHQCFLVVCPQSPPPVFPRRMSTKSSTSVSSSYLHQVLHQCLLVVCPPSPPPVFPRQVYFTNDKNDLCTCSKSQSPLAYLLL